MKKTTILILLMISMTGFCQNIKTRDSANMGIQEYVIISVTKRTVNITKCFPKIDTLCIKLLDSFIRNIDELDIKTKIRISNTVRLSNNHYFNYDSKIRRKLKKLEKVIPYDSLKLEIESSRKYYLLRTDNIYIPDLNTILFSKYPVKNFGEYYYIL